MNNTLPHPQNFNHFTTNHSQFVHDLNCIEDRWYEILNKPNSPALLGLMPMGDEEIKKIRFLLHSWLGSIDRIGRAFDEYPALTSTWISVLASSAYDHGKFYEKFSELLGWPNALSSQYERQQFLTKLRNCWLKMNRPKWRSISSGKHLVSEFLFYAGFPICHSDKLAYAIKHLEKIGQLPDTNEIDASDQLVESLLNQFSSKSVPTLVSAIDSSAGSLIAEAALAVLQSGNFEGINPKLGESLRKAFDNQSLNLSGPRLKAPYIRLSSDLSDLEFVCPSQPKAFVKEGKFAWSICDIEYPHSPMTEFIWQHDGSQSVKIDAVGLEQGYSLERIWDFESITRTESHVYIFHNSSRKLLKKISLIEGGCELPIGEYWCLIPQSYYSDDCIAEQQWESVHLCKIELTPGTEVEFESWEDESFTISTKSTPAILPESYQTIISDDGKKVHLGEDAMLNLWIPNTSRDSSDLILIARSGNKEVRINLERLEYKEDWLVSQVGLFQLALNLEPGLHLVECSVRSDSGALCSNQFYFWAGDVRKLEDNKFSYSIPPFNLSTGERDGFAVDGERISPIDTLEPYRVLSFEIESQIHSFKWKNENVCLQVIDRRIGSNERCKSLKLGNSIIASSAENTWLKVWIPKGLSSKEILLDSKPLGLRTKDNEVLEVSLSELSLRQPDGGVLSLALEQSVIELASYFRPLTPLKNWFHKGENGQTADFQFCEEVNSCRVRATNLVTGKTVFSNTISFDNESIHEVIFDASTFLRIRNVSTYDSELQNIIGIDISKYSNSPGLWMIQVEIARSPKIGFESLKTNKSHGVSFLTHNLTSKKNDLVSVIFLRAIEEYDSTKFRSYFDLDLDKDTFEQVVDVLVKIQKRCDIAAPDFWWVSWFEKALGSHSKKILKEGDRDGGKFLLKLADSEPGFKRLVYTPEILSLDEASYLTLKTEHPLLLSMTLSSQLSEWDWISEFIAEHQEFYARSFLQEFSNFKEIFRHGPIDELANFDLRSFWTTLMPTSRLHEFELRQAKKLLSNEHFNWAVNCLKERYKSNAQNEQFGYIGQCARRSINLVKEIEKLDQRLSKLLPAALHANYYPRIKEDYIIQDMMLPLCSVIALAARYSSKEELNFRQLLEILKFQSDGQFLNKSILSAFELAPELLGFFILLWQTILTTGPHDN